MEKRIEMQFFKTEAMYVSGSLALITEKLNEINQSPKKKLIFLSNIITTGDIAHAIIQYQERR